MDDVLSGCHTSDEVVKLQHEIQTILASGGFQMRKWLCNEKHILDEFKRPIIIIAKIIIQQLWRANIGWDDEFPSELQAKWQGFREELPFLNSLSIPRYALISQPLLVELHGFSDASTAAYVSQIQEMTNINDWHHCKSEDNPSDLISRGCDVNTFLNSTIWFNGPEWLSQDESECPRDEIFLNETEIPEQRVIANVSTSSEQLSIFKSYSKLSKLQRILAYVLRFINNCKSTNVKASGNLSTNELQGALNLLIKHSQLESFPREYNDLTKGLAINSKSSILGLNPFLDENQVIRVG
ncbi:hypothetical protein NQ317_014738 [Molorchus minor]|uniref:Uncharacterized protein n=1 Tax=Molorchus minor TaxID=1323400 RepID=A0ABQ9IZE4_9CUCU|nr:hypothetical protein NQ317_014738 [Molorchus minor]